MKENNQIYFYSKCFLGVAVLSECQVEPRLFSVSE